ncbi:MFS transporter [Pseudonocardia sp. N23]|uniref:MFS transporter n=1 Tax=Pseudonocardia sp. N23 TaxID=1987376 RepID=UPI000C025AAD|nr:MFS transporter [Pseudonocardia sp. N23]GAY11546.1 transporter, putative [Pseudonocardia sp. N23]
MLLTVQTGCVISAFGAYLVAITADTGWTPGLVAVAFAIIQLGNGTISPVTGWACDRFGTRAVAALGTLLTAAGCAMVAQAGTTGGFIGAVVVVSLGCSAAGITPLTVAVVQSLTDRRTLALGLLPSGIALGGLLVPAVVWLLDAVGWRTTFLVVAAVTLVVGLVATLWLPGPVARPARSGQGMRWGRRRVAVAAPEAPVVGPDPGTGPDMDLRAAIRTSAFWLLIVGHGCALVAVGAMNLHLVPLMTHGRGFDLAIAGLAVAGMSVTQLVGQIVTGVVGDRFDKRRLAVGCMVVQTAVLVVLATASSLVLVVAAALVHGLAWGLRGPAMNAIRADYFGTRAFGTITGWSMGFVSLGMVGGPLLVSVFAEGSGGYPAGFLAATVATVAGLVAFLVVRPPRPREPAGTRAAAGTDLAATQRDGGCGCAAAPGSAA